MLAGMVNTSNNEINLGKKTVQHMIPHCVSHAVTAPAISNSAHLSTSELQAWFPLLAPSGLIIMMEIFMLGNFRMINFYVENFFIQTIPRHVNSAHAVFVRLIFVVAIDYENIFTTKISRFIVLILLN